MYKTLPDSPETEDEEKHIHCEEKDEKCQENDLIKTLIDYNTVRQGAAILTTWFSQTVDGCKTYSKSHL